MGGRQYYCDYCDRSFKDSYEARRKHLSSLQHVKMREDYYRQFKGPEEILQEETAKIPCKKVNTENGCPFGTSCRFSHYTAPMMWELQRIVALKHQKKVQELLATVHNPADIINEYFQDPVIPISSERIDQPIWNYPAELKNYPNLPPSLRPITPASIKDSNFAEWG